MALRWTQFQGLEHHIFVKNVAMKKLLFNIVLLTIVTVQPTFAQQRITDSIRKQLEIGISGFKERYHAPSVVLAIVHHDSIIFSGADGFTDLDQKIPATIDSKYQIQSISKMFTATMLMQLWEKGIITLDDDVRKYVPEFAGLNREGNPETTSLLELATHTAGLPRNSPSEFNFFKDVEKLNLTKQHIKSLESSNKAAFINALGKIQKEYPAFEYLPNDQRHYSNLGYSLLGLALERAVKTNYDSYIKSAICNPLGLSHTGVGTISSPENTIAKGYRFLNDQNLFVQTPDYYANAMAPASGMSATARDLAKFISAQFNATKPLISEKSIRMMQSLGIGWQRNYPYLRHEGSMLGFRCEIVVHPGLEVGWVILTNATDFEFNRFDTYISSLILPAFAKTPLTDPERYVGNYSLAGGIASFSIYQKDGKLYTTYLADVFADTALKFSGNNSMMLEDQTGKSVRFEFILDKKGKVSLLNLNQLTWKRD